jgi:hypothetical protein
VTQHADNYRFDITAYEDGESSGMLRLCLRVAFAGHSTATHWSTEDGVLAKTTIGRFKPEWQKPPRLILHWTSGLSDGDPEKLIPFLAPQSYEFCVGSVQAWLEGVDYANEPDHDGDNSRGWRIYNEVWGHVGGHRGAICAVEPAWLMHGK